MTNAQQHSDAPTKKQLRYLRNLAMSRGESFTPPQTKAEASSEIQRLKGRQATSSAERRYEEAGTRRALTAQGRGRAASVRRREVEGYGSSATWKKTTFDDEDEERLRGGRWS